MFTDPLAFTYDGNAKSLPRVSASANGTIYRTADGEFEVRISSVTTPRNGNKVSVRMTRKLPDPTPSNVFDDYRAIENSYTLSIEFDSSRAESSVDIPRLRTALLALVDSTFQSRLMSGEK
jgi:hypothetical protein